MKLNSSNRSLICGAIVLAGIGLQSSSAQEATNESFAPAVEQLRAASEQLPASAIRAAEEALRAYNGKVIAANRSGQDMKSEIRRVAEELRDAKDGEAKSKAEANLRGLLSKYFEADMVRRKAELTAMEERLRKLNEQLGRRRDKMQEIVDLQFKVLTNEADGLGFFSNGPDPRGSLSGPGMAIDYLDATVRPAGAANQQQQAESDLFPTSPVTPPSSPAPAATPVPAR